MNIIEQNKASSRRVLAELDRGNFDIFGTAAAPNAVVHFPGMPPMGMADFKQFCAAFYAAFPDLTHEIMDMVGEGDKVARIGLFKGTQKGEFQGIPPTGKKISASFMAVDRFENGKLVEITVQPDMMTMMQQLGVIPAMA